MKVDVYTIEGAKSGDQVELPSHIFGIEPNDHLIYQAVVTEMANRRLGSHSKKTRSEKRGGGAKPWRQKGTGRARAGTIRSPIWVGGGVAFAPIAHKHKKRMNHKAKQLARRSAFTHRARDGEVMVVENLEFDKPKTKRAATLLFDMGLNEKKVLILTGKLNQALFLSVRNLHNVQIEEARNVSTYDILDAESIVITQAGLEDLTENLSSES